MTFRMDTSQLDDFARDLGKESMERADAVRAIIKKGALNIKNDLREQADASGIAEAKAAARAITFDTKLTPTGIAAEIGPQEGQSGSFAFLWYGNSKNGPVLPEPGDALEREADNIVENLDRWLGSL